MNTVALFPKMLILTLSPPRLLYGSHPLSHTLKSKSYSQGILFQVVSVFSITTSDEPNVKPDEKKQQQQKNHYLQTFQHYKYVVLDVYESFKNTTFIIFIATFKILHVMAFFQDTWYSGFTKFFVH